MNDNDEGQVDSNDGDDEDDDDDDNDDDDDVAAGENILLRHTQTKAQVIVGQV